MGSENAFLVGRCRTEGLTTRDRLEKRCLVSVLYLACVLYLLAERNEDGGDRGIGDDDGRALHRPRGDGQTRRGAATEGAARAVSKRTHEDLYVSHRQGQDVKQNLPGAVLCHPRGVHVRVTRRNT